MCKRLCFHLLALLLALCYSTLSWSQESTQDTGNWQWHGYVKTYPALLIPQEGKSSTFFQNSLRLNLSNQFNEDLRFEVHYEFMPFIEPPKGFQASQAVEVSEAGSFRIDDLDDKIYPDEPYNSSLNVYQNLDRLNLRWALPLGDLTLGRQAVTFGSARIISPSDVILPFSLQSLNQEYRPGVDAVRFQSPLGELGEFDVGVVIGEEGTDRNNVYFVRSKVYYKQTDITGLLAQVREGHLVSLGLERALWKFGSWFEVAYMKPPNEPSYTRLSTGLDYAFSPEVLAMVEYHYNEAGASAAGDYVETLQSFAYQKGGVFLMGQHYIISSLSWQMHPLISLGTQAFLNLSDSSSLWSSQLTYNKAENLYLDFGFFAPLGAPPSGAQLQSEYGLYPNLLYTAARYYF